MEQSDRPSLPRCLLSVDEARQIFRRAIEPVFLASRTPSSQPHVLLVGGTPGSGKTTMARGGMGGLRPDDSVLLDVDDLRAFHPAYERLARADDRTASWKTHADVQRWIDWLVRLAIQRRLNVVLVGALRSPEKTAGVIAAFKKAGYTVDVVFVACAPAHAGLGVLSRYVDARDPALRLGFGRHVQTDYQRAAQDGLPTTADRIDHDGIVDRVFVFRRDGRCVYANSVEGNAGWCRPAVTRQTLEREVNRAWSAGEREWFYNEVARICPLLPTACRPDLAAVVRSAVINWP